MSTELETRIREAARPPTPPDPMSAWTEGRARRRRRHVGTGALGLAAAALLFAGLALSAGRHDDRSVFTDPGTTVSVPPVTIDTSGTGWTTMTDPEGRFTIDVPPGWAATTDNLVPWLTSPVEIFSAATHPLERPADPEQQSAACDAVVPVAAVQGGPTDAFATIQDAEAGRDVFPPDAPVTRQVDHVIGEGSFEQVPSRTDFSCAARQAPGTDARWIWFGADGGTYYLAVVIGPDASPQTRAELWAMVDSFRAP